MDAVDGRGGKASITLDMKSIPTVLALFVSTCNSAIGGPSLESRAEPVRVEVYPSRFSLDGRASRQRVVVTAIFADGRVFDATRRAKLTVGLQVVAVSSDGIVRPLSDGSATLTARFGNVTGKSEVVVRNQKRPVVWSFENHVEPVLAKQGCNTGPCHGAAAGKGGFRLTLRGFDPDLDYQRLTQEARGRRIVKSSPAESLLLKKPSLGAPHVGGLRLRRDSAEYRVVAEWIASGASGPNPKEPKIAGIEVYPKERTLAKGDEQQVLVTARFTDGHTEDVTHWARYTSNDEPVAKVDGDGLVKMHGPGETSVSVWYAGKVAFARLAVPFPNRVDSGSYASLPRRSYVDDLIHAKLRKLRILPSETSSDPEFIRRVYLDTIGGLPAPESTRAFLKDTDPEKRRKLIAELLDRPEYAEHWTYKLGDLFRVNRDILGNKGMWAFHTWLKQSVLENKPWDRIAAEIITASGPANRPGPAGFFRAGKTAEEYSENVSQVFLGIRVQCAKCHNHPFEKWTQSDYFRMANFFARVGNKVDATSGGPAYFSASQGNVDHPKLGKPLPPKPFDGPQLALDSKLDRRRFLADWLVSPENPYFARNIVNRVWKHYMGRGLVEPADDMRLTNPATNEPLLDALTKDFVKHEYDLKYLATVILNSAAYQASSKANATNAADDRFYSRYLVRRLTAETLLDAICQVTDQSEKFAGIPKGARAVSLPDTNVASSFLDLFGRPARQVTCDCERNMEPNVSQALHFIGAAEFNKKVSAKDGLLDRLLDSGKNDRAVVDELYLASLSRQPTATESANILGQIRAAVNAVESAEDVRSARRQVFVDLLWALLSSPEFMFNH